MDAIPERGQTAVDSRSAGTQRRQTSGLTTRLILAYAERQRGRAGVEALLRRCGLQDLEAQLRDENCWFDFETKVALFEAAEVVLADPDAALHIGRAAIELNTGATLKRALRAFGSPRMVYANVIRASGKFTWAHRWEILDLGGGRARLRYFDVSGVGYRRQDCQYNQGLLSCVPKLFGLPSAEIRHDVCAVEGAPHCIYDVTWSEPTSLLRPGVAIAAATAAVGGALAATARSYTPAAAAVPVLGAAALVARSHRRLRLRLRSLEDELRAQREVAERLQSSLRDMASDLQLEEVLGKVTRNASAAVGGKEFALLVAAEGGVRCEASSDLPAGALTTLERWAEETPSALEAPLTVDDVSRVPSLASLASDPSMTLGSLISAPLVLRDRKLGVLVALAHGTEVFLPEDTRLLESYASEAAIALANARMLERLQRLAKEDSLTGLLNYRAFHDTIERELRRAERYDRRFTIVMLDLDNFKQINDSYGHAEGDRVLRAVADRLRAAGRSSDFAFRVGGDEFALLLPETSAEAAGALARRLAAAVDALELGVAISFGVAECPEAGDTKEALLLAADAALYRAKGREPPAGAKPASADARSRSDSAE